MTTRRRTTRRTFLGSTSIGAAAAATSGMVPYIPWTATAFANQEA
ncbi:MAG: twin-arginine translocation signal domain-containing protein, partial [Planctomycetia bacterium]